MADVSSIEINEVTYSIKDGTARTSASSAMSTANNAKTEATAAKTLANTAKTTADGALEKAGANETKITTLEGEILSVSYLNEKITFTKGV